MRLINELIAKDDKDPFAHYVASVIYLWKRDYERSAFEAETALALNPNYALALNARGFVYIYTGVRRRSFLLNPNTSRSSPTAISTFSWHCLFPGGQRPDCSGGI